MDTGEPPPANPVSTLVSQPQWLHPVLAGPATLLAYARTPQTMTAVGDVLRRLVPDPYIEFMLGYYAAGRERFGPHWEYADQVTVLHAAARLLQPRNYLEIGVFRGRSLAIVGAAAPQCALYGFDQWIPGYAGLDNLGPELVREQLRRAGHAGGCTLESGNSHETVPRFLAAHPELMFDLVTVDGDHTEEGARLDLEVVLPRLCVGGALVFDDIRHPRHPWLERVWDEVVASLPSFAAAKFTEVGHGVALAVRREAGDTVLDGLRGSPVERTQSLAHALEEARAKARERVEALEAEMQRRLVLIEQQGAQLGRIEGLELLVGQLRQALDVSEADRARRLELIEQQGVELGRLPGLETQVQQLQQELQQWRQALDTSEADRVERLRVIESLGTQVDTWRGLVADVQRELQALRGVLEEPLVGVLPLWRRQRLRRMAADTLARLRAVLPTPAGLAPAAERPSR